MILIRFDYSKITTKQKMSNINKLIDIQIEKGFVTMLEVKKYFDWNNDGNDDFEIWHHYPFTEPFTKPTDKTELRIDNSDLSFERINAQLNFL